MLFGFNLDYSKAHIHNQYYKWPFHGTHKQLLLFIYVLPSISFSTVIRTQRENVSFCNDGKEWFHSEVSHRIAFLLLMICINSIFGEGSLVLIYIIWSPTSSTSTANDHSFLEKYLRYFVITKELCYSKKIIIRRIIIPGDKNQLLYNMCRLASDNLTLGNEYRDYVKILKIQTCKIFFWRN